MENREIIIDNQIVPYQLQRKNIKKCYLKIVSGKVMISAGKYYTIKDIEKLILDNKNILLHKLQSYQAKKVYEDGGYVYIFDKRYTIEVNPLGLKKCKLDGQTLRVYHKDVEKVVEAYIKEILLQYVHQRIDTYIAQYFTFIKPMIQIQKVKSRWGACFYKQNKISFTLSLVHLDTTLIDYVIMHELCHKLQHNHSPAFYQELKARMPDYKEREKRLKEESI